MQRLTPRRLDSTVDGERRRTQTSPTGHSPVLDIRQVSKSFAGTEGEVRALTDVSMTAWRGEFVAIVGPSGCGKSTLLEIIANLQSPTSGTVLIDGLEGTARARSVGYMPQKDLLLPWRSVLDNTILGLEVAGMSRGRARAEAIGWFERFGLAGFEHHYPATLSGGMRQRASLLRTFLTGREILVLDEPFGALDALTRMRMQEWLLGIHDEFHKTIVLVTHDVDEALYLSDRVYVMTSRPGTMGGSFDVSLSRPRRYEQTVTSPAFTGLKRSLLQNLTQTVRGGGAVMGYGAAARRALIRWGPSALVLVGFLVLWQVLTVVRHVPSYLLPGPVDIWRAGMDEHELLLTNAVPTLEIAVYGFGLAVLIGLGAAIAIRFSSVLEAAVYPIVIVSQTVPVVALAPVLVVLLGFTILPKLIIVALICFFPIAVNAVDGFHSVDPDLVKLMRSLGAGRWRIFRTVEWPSALPFIFSGAKVAVTFSVVGALFGEWAGSSEGLGYLMTQKESQFDTGALFAAIALLSLIGIGLFAAVSVAERRLLPWYHGDRRGNAVHGSRK